MKIAFEINEKYKKPEIHICSDRDDHESRKIYMTVMEVFEKNITAYDDNEPVMIRHGDIVRIFTQNKNVYLLTEKRQYRLRERLYELEELCQDIQFGNRECEENNQAGHKHYRNNQDVHEGRYTDLCIQKICKQDKEDIKIIKTAYI